MGYTYLDHAADLAVRAWGADLDEAFAEAARALTSAMVNLRRVRDLRARQFSLGASSLALLLVDWLAAVVAEKDTSGFVFCRFDVHVSLNTEEPSLEATAWGEPLDPLRHEAGSEVKGISLLGLSVRAEGTGWTIEYVADI